MTTYINKRTGRIIPRFAAGSRIKACAKTNQKIFYPSAGKPIPFCFDFKVEYKNRKQLAIASNSGVFYVPIINKISKSHRNYIYDFVLFKEQENNCQLVFENFNTDGSFGLSKSGFNRKELK